VEDIAESFIAYSASGVGFQRVKCTAGNEDTGGASVGSRQEEEQEDHSDAPRIVSRCGRTGWQGKGCRAEWGKYDIIGKCIVVLLSGNQEMAWQSSYFRSWFLAEAATSLSSHYRCDYEIARVRYRHPPSYGEGEKRKS